MFKLEGFENLLNGIEKMAENAEQLSGEQTTALDKLMDEKFMNKYTDFPSIDEFFENSHFTVKTNEDLDLIDMDKLDIYVNEKTKFSSWKEMNGKAVGEYSMKNIMDGTGFRFE